MLDHIPCYEGGFKVNTHPVALESLLIVLLVCAASPLSAQVTSRPVRASGTEAAVRTTYNREKSTHFRFDHLRAGAIRSAKGWWNVQDFAHSLFNPNSEEITVNLKMISDDPKFVFANGQVGTYTKAYHLKPLFGITDNVYLCPVFESQNPKPNWPVSSRTNFTGSVEFSSSKPFYYFMLHETPEGVSPDLVKAYFMAWDPCEYDEPGVWDNDLNKFVIQYTNYWHDENTWRVGWHSELEIKNNTDQPMTYTLEHIPYYGGQYDPGTQQVIKYKEQVVPLTLKPHEAKRLTLMKLYGWGDKMSSMEGCLLITPGHPGAKSGTSAGLLIVPNDSGEPFHAAIM
jgi:hypothetical protein